MVAHSGHFVTVGDRDASTFHLCDYPRITGCAIWSARQLDKTEVAGVKIVVKGPAWNFVQHLLEMSIAMVVGMFALGLPLKALFDAVGLSFMNDYTVPMTLVMATTMSVGMAVWMRIRGCGWPAILEMSLAMYVPFVGMYPFYWAGLVDEMAIMIVGHVLMVPAMVVAMLFRLDEYTGAHHHHHKPAEKELATQAES
jgi:hypothetical protein